MPDLPISGLPAVTTPQPSDVFAIVNSGITKKTTVQDVGNAVFTQISSSVILPSQTGSFSTTSSFNNYTSSINSFTQSYYQTTSSFGVTPYFGSFYHTSSIVVTALSTPTTMSLNTTDFSYGVSISGSTNDKIKFASGGYYDIQFSAQMAKTTGTTSAVYIWIRKNDVDVPWSNTGVTLAGGDNDVATPAWNWFVSSSANDYYQIMWSVVGSTNNTFITASSSSTGGGPEVPSLIVTVNRVG